MPRLKLHFLWLDEKISGAFRTGVSLHSHTSHSRESLHMVPDYARQSRVLSLGVRALCSRYKEKTASELDFSRPFFVSPMSASEAFRIEATQIEDLNLEALVSITDHDSIEAPLQLRMFMDETKVPISMEWTVPFLNSVFHVGIHGLRTNGIHSLIQELACTSCHRCREAGTSCAATAPGIACQHAHIAVDSVEGLFAHLNEEPQTLVVLNHPLWDAVRVGADQHRAALSAFLGRFGRHIHAIEVNGLRPWTENLAAMDLAERWKLPVISGGDRHGCEPNAILNLTRQTSFQAFVEEIRVERRSEIVFMNQYREPINFRKMRTVIDLLREYPHQQKSASLTFHSELTQLLHGQDRVGTYGSFYFATVGAQ